MYLKIKGRSQKARRAAGCESPMQSFIVVVSATTAIFLARCSLVIAICALKYISALQAFQLGKNLGACIMACPSSVVFLLEELCAEGLASDFKILAFASAIFGLSGASLGTREARHSIGSAHPSLPGQRVREKSISLCRACGSPPSSSKAGHTDPTIRGMAS